MLKEDSGRPDGWADVCIKCGLCCLVKICSQDGDVFLTKVLCDYLDKETRMCTCYSEDFDSRGGCGQDNNGSRLDLHTLKNDYVVPGCCPYVQKYVGKNRVRTPQINFDECVYEKDVDSANAHIIGNSHTLFKYNPAVNKLLKENMRALKKK